MTYKFFTYNKSKVYLIKKINLKIFLLMQYKISLYKVLYRIYSMSMYI